MKRCIAMILILLLISSVAMAEGLAGVRREKLHRQFGVWGLTKQLADTRYGYDVLAYMDQEQKTCAALVSTEDSVVAAIYFANDDDYGKAFLREMSMSTVAGSNYLVQMVYGLFLELAMDELQDGESRESEIDYFAYGAYREGNMLYSYVADASWLKAVSGNIGTTAPEETAEDGSVTPTPTPSPVSTSEPQSKPGLDGSNAYDITVAAETLGLTVGDRQNDSDGYRWTITGFSAWGTYVISIDANKQYEISRATFALNGTDTTIFPWAASLKYDQGDVDAVTEWVKRCQKDKTEDVLHIGDAVWSYKPHDNGGVLTLEDAEYPAYCDDLIDQLTQ